MLLHGRPGVVGGKPRRHTPVRTMFSFKNPCKVSPPSFPVSGAAACGDSRISHQSPVTNHQSPQLCGDFLATRHSPIATSPVTSLQCAVTQIEAVTPLECALTKKVGGPHCCVTRRRSRPASLGLHSVV